MCIVGIKNKSTQDIFEVRNVTSIDFNKKYFFVTYESESFNRVSKKYLIADYSIWDIYYV